MVGRALQSVIDACRVVGSEQFSETGTGPSHTSRSGSWALARGCRDPWALDPRLEELPLAVAPALQFSSGPSAGEAARVREGTSGNGLLACQKACRTRASIVWSM